MATALIDTGTDTSSGGVLTGIGQLVRLALRRDRVILPIWLVALIGLVAASVASMVGLYATEADRVRYATVAAANAIGRAFDGPMAGSSLGAITMTEVYGFLAVLVGIMSVQTVVRHTRQEEETGRAELVGSAVVGRHAPLTAALVVVIGANLLLGIGVGITFAAFGLPTAGSVLAATAVAGVGISFAAVAAVTAQVAATQRGANGLGMAAIGAAFLVRAVGDAMGTVGPSGVEVISAWPSWLSPIGWGQQVRSFGDARWTVLLLFPLLTGVLIPLAYRLRSHRDVGGGLMAVRRGPATAAGHLCSPLGLAWRLQRGALLAWMAGSLVMAAAMGAIAEEAEELLSTSDELSAMLAGISGAELTDLFFAFYMALMSLAAAAYAVQALLRARNEERSGRAEPILATSVSRTRWLLGHVTVAAVGTAALLLMSGMVAGIVHAVDTGDAEPIAGLLMAGLVNLPAPLALGGFVVAVIGLTPRWAPALAWAALVLSLVMGQLGELLGLPQPVLDLSPFTHTPAVPADPVVWTPLLALVGVAVTLTAVGITALRRRDVMT